MGDKVWLPFPVFLLAALSPVLLPGAACFTPSLDSDFTFTLPAGQKECFYQPMPLKASLEIEYQVSAQESQPRSLPELHRAVAPRPLGSFPRTVAAERRGPRGTRRSAHARGSVSPAPWTEKPGRTWRELAALSPLLWWDRGQHWWCR